MSTASHHRFVAHIDILGMSEIVAKDPDEAWDMLSALVDARDAATNVSLEFVGSAKLLYVPELIRAVTFSDTIVFFTRGATDDDLRALIVTVLQVFQKALYNRVPIRIGIAYGLFYFNLERSMYAGPALIDAYRVGESAQWLGIVFSRSLGDRGRALGLRRGHSEIVVDWPVPSKQGKQTMSVINWPAAVSEDFKVTPPLSIAQFYEIFEPTFGPLSDLQPEVVTKYANTVEFINVQYEAHEQ